MVMPTTPPTIEWVVETGILANVASMRNTVAPTSAESIPIAYTVMLESQKPHAQQCGLSVSATPFWIVLDTP